MSSYAASMRKWEAERRKEERETRKRQALLQKQLKELEKLSLIQQAQLQVESFENEIDLLLSVHKESSSDFDWKTLANALPPHPATRWGRCELGTYLDTCASPNSASADWDALLQEARALDEEAFQKAWEGYVSQYGEWAKMKDLAARVLSGDASAYTEAINEFSAFVEISHLGSSIHMKIDDPKTLSCVIKVNGRDVIPSEAKSLTASGKLSVKAMPKARFHEIYQDYVCGCVLRVAREVLSLLPVDVVLVTAVVDGIDPATGQLADVPVLSAAIPRKVTDDLDFERLDPSDSLENFLHRGDVQMSRKSGEFVRIEPLTRADLPKPVQVTVNLDGSLDHIRKLRASLALKLKVPSSQPDLAQ